MLPQRRAAAGAQRRPPCSPRGDFSWAHRRSGGEKPEEPRKRKGRRRAAPTCCCASQISKPQQLRVHRPHAGEGPLAESRETMARKLKSSPSLARQKWSANNVAGWAVAMGLERQRLVVKWAGPSSEFDYSPETSTFSFGTPPCPVRTIICRRCAQGHRRRSTATAAGPSLSVMRQDFGGAMHLMRILPG
jgi:hypothetical protein